MRHLKLCAALIFFTLSQGFAQNGTSFLSLRAGAGIKNAVFGSVSYDYNRKYFNQNEVFAEYYLNQKSNYHTILGGFGIKPVITRARNTALRLRFGLAVGSDDKNLIAVPQIGFELSQTFAGGVDLFIGNRNSIVFWAPNSERWRVLGEFGLRIPLKK